MALNWDFSFLFTALFAQQSNTGSVLTSQPQSEWFVEGYHSQCHNLVWGHWTDKSRAWGDPSSPGANQLNTLDRSGELGTRTRPAAGQHWHLLHRLTPRVAGRYCCALPDDLQGLHFSRVAASTCMSALDVPRKLKSSVLHSHVGGIGLAWASAHFLLYRKAPLLPSAAGFCAKALVRPAPPPFPDCRRQQRPEGLEGRRCLTIGIFSPRKKLD